MIEWKKLEEYPECWINNIGQVWSERSRKFLFLCFVKKNTYITLYTKNRKKEIIRPHILIRKYFSSTGDKTLNNVFRKIKDFENYLVNEKGEVWSSKSHKLLKPYIAQGYLIVSLRKGDRTYKKSVHRLILETFVERSLKDCVGHHEDFNRKNNSLNNLRWVSYSENNRLISESGKLNKKTWMVNLNKKQRGENHPNSKLTNEQALEIRQMRTKGKLVSEIAKVFGISKAIIYYLCSNKSNNQGDFHEKR